MNRWCFGNDLRYGLFSDFVAASQQASNAPEAGQSLARTIAALDIDVGGARFSQPVGDPLR
jgi:hypothetical protein